MTVVEMETLLLTDFRNTWEVEVVSERLSNIWCKLKFCATYRFSSALC